MDSGCSGVRGPGLNRNQVGSATASGVWNGNNPLGSRSQTGPVQSFAVRLWRFLGFLPLDVLLWRACYRSPKLRTEWGSLSDRYPAYTKAVEDSDSVFALVSDRLPERSLVETALTSGCSAKVTNSIRIPGATLFWPIDRANGFRIWMQEGRIPPPGLGCREK